MNIVPTPATRALAAQAVAHAIGCESGYDAALRWLPEVRPEQVPAFVGLVLSKAAGLDPTPVEQLQPVGRVTACRECGTGFTSGGSRSRRTAKAGRGLCRPCYDHHYNAGTLDKFPPLIRLAPRLGEAS